ncbi:hypothetical protein PINS_up004964 [Pythium insidiosum]|nr:hypothetical protein PINS_up004964 [Pythium insidiosum]
MWVPTNKSVALGEKHDVYESSPCTPFALASPGSSAPFDPPATAAAARDDYTMMAESPAKLEAPLPPPEKLAPSAPPAELEELDASFTVPEPLPPSHFSKCRWLWLTLVLVPYHILNFALGTAGFCLAVTGVCVSAVLLPLCCLGALVYALFLPLLRVLAVLDVALANTITRSDQQVRFNVPDDVSVGSELDGGLRIAPKLARVSLRSTLAVLYFATVKFVLGVVSIVSVSLPWLPIVSQMLADYASDTVNSMVAGFSPKKFNFGTNPLLYTLTCIGYLVVGVICMHVFGRVSRGTTRRVLAKQIRAVSAA